MIYSHVVSVRGRDSLITLESCAKLLVLVVFLLSKV